MDSSARIASVAVAVPEYPVPLAQTLEHAARVFGENTRGLRHVLGVIERSGIETRHLVVPVEEVIAERTLAQRSQQYREKTLLLSMQAVPDALARADLRAEDVDHVITVSCTGVMIPSLDAELMNLLPFRRDCRRTPITELGCAAGAVALSRAADHVRAYPGETVLVVAVETPSLTFQRRDQTMTNVVASCLFADGAAAAVVTGRPGGGPRILASRSELLPQTQHIMGFDLMDGGLHIKLDRDIVPLLDAEVNGMLDRFLAPRGLTPQDLGFFVLHPGGRKLLEVMEKAFDVTREATLPSWDVLREHGNMSSATVLHVLDRLTRTQKPQPGERGLLAAFGPGFSSELVLLQWN